MKLSIYALSSLLLLLSWAGCFSLTASERSCSQDELALCKLLFQDALLEKNDALRQLKALIETNPNLKKQAVSVPVAGRKTIDFFLSWANQRIFSAADALRTMFSFAGEKTIQDKENLVGNLIKNCLEGDFGEEPFALALVTYAFNKFPICVDTFEVPGYDDDEKVYLGAVLASSRHSGVFQAEITQLVQNKRIALGSFDVSFFKELVLTCLIEKRGIDELKTFVNSNRATISKLIPHLVFHDQPFSSWLMKKHPAIYPTIDAVLDILQITKPKRTPLTDLEKISYCAHELTDYLKHLEDPGMRDAAVFTVQKNFLDSVDQYPYSETETLGEALEKVKSPETRRILLSRVSRWTTQARDCDGRIFEQLVLRWLVSQDALFDKELAFYLKNFSVEEYRRDAQKSTKVFDTVTLVMRLSPRLFPHRAEILQRLQLADDSASSALSFEEYDKKCLEELIKASLSRPDLVPLVEYGFRSYKKLYAGQKKAAVDLFALNQVSGQSVGAYCLAHAEEPYAQRYLKLFSQDSWAAPSQGKKAHTPSLSKQKRSDSTLLRTFLWGCSFGLALYAFHTYYKNSYRKVVIRAV